MSTEVTAFRRTESLPSHAVPLVLTGSLAYHVAGAAIIDGHYSPVQGHPSQGDIREAQTAILRAEHLCRQPDLAIIVAWMKKFRTLPRAPADEANAQAAVAAVALANGDLPAAVWTAETAAQGLRTFRIYPS